VFEQTLPEIISSFAQQRRALFVSASYRDLELSCGQEFCESGKYSMLSGSAWCGS